MWQLKATRPSSKSSSKERHHLARPILPDDFNSPALTNVLAQIITQRTLTSRRPPVDLLNYSQRKSTHTKRRNTLFPKRHKMFKLFTVNGPVKNHLRPLAAPPISNARNNPCICGQLSFTRWCTPSFRPSSQACQRSTAHAGPLPPPEVHAELHNP